MLWLRTLLPYQQAAAGKTRNVFVLKTQKRKGPFAGTVQNGFRLTGIDGVVSVGGHLFEKILAENVWSKLIAFATKVDTGTPV